MTALRIRAPSLGGLDLDREERELFLWMCGLVAILLAAHTLAKVLRDSLFLSEYGAARLPVGYIVVALASVGIVWLEPRLVRRWSRIDVNALAQITAIAFSVAAALLYPMKSHWLAGAFYVWVGTQGLLLLAHFWVLALEVWDSRRARAIFPLLSGAGLLGGLLAGAFASWAAPILGIDALLWSLAGFLVVARAISMQVETRRRRRPLVAQMAVTGSSWQVVSRSSFLRILVLALSLSVAVATLVDFQFKFMAQHVYPERHDLTRFLGTFYAGLNGLALFVQFGAAGWILRRVGLGAATALQPASILTLAVPAMIAPSWAIIAAMRWTQGVVFQTVGKSTTELYYLAVRPPERRRVKPAIDTVVERASDALVGVLLLVVFRSIGIRLEVLAGFTAVAAAIWIAVVFRLNHEYVRSFRESLVSRWLEPEAASGPLRATEVRQALLQTLTTGSEQQVVLALRLAHRAPYPEVREAVRACSRASSPRVRAAALRAMAALNLADETQTVRLDLKAEDPELRRAAVEYLIAFDSARAEFARELLEGPDSELRQYALDALAERPGVAQQALSLEWIDAGLASSDREQRAVAARALGILGGPAVEPRLADLLAQKSEDVEVRRAALRSAARRPSPAFLPHLLEALAVRSLTREAQEAIAALRDVAVSSLRRRLAEETHPWVRWAIASALARIGTPRAVSVLVELARSADQATRYVGLRKLNRIRLERGWPVLPRNLVHKTFIRELRDYRNSVEPALELRDRSEPEVQLLVRSFLESADRALDRACRALGCWYDPYPLVGVYEGLRSREREPEARALEYLSQLLPRRVYKPVRSLFEDHSVESQSAAAKRPSGIEYWIRIAWESPDDWLRACSVRAGRRVGIDLSIFRPGPDDGSLVRSELQSLQEAGSPSRGGSEKGFQFGGPEPLAAGGTPC